MNGANPLTVLGGLANRQSVAAPPGMGGIMVASFTDFRANRGTQATLNWGTNAGSAEWWAKRSATQQNRMNFIKFGTHGYSIRLWEAAAGGPVLTYAITSAALTQIGDLSPQKADIWEHWCLTWDGVTHRAYRNGVETANAPNAGSYTNSTGAFFVGGSTTGEEIDGAITGLGIYQRALTPTEVKEHYAVGMALVPVASIVSGPTKSRISSVSGQDSTDITWKSDSDFQAYQIRSVPLSSSAVTEGVLVESNQVVTNGSQNTNYTSTITDDEIVANDPGDEPKLLKVFVQSYSGNWST
jgi:hypothetical protein